MQLSDIEQDRQLTQRRLDIEELKKRLAQITQEFKAQIDTLTAQVDAITPSTQTGTPTNINLTSSQQVKGAVSQQVAYGTAGGALGFSSKLTWDGSKMGIGAAPKWSSATFAIWRTTDANLSIGVPVALANGVTILSHNDAVTQNRGLELRGSPIMIADITSTLGFFGRTPNGSQTLNPYTPNSQAGSYTSTPGSLATAATLADLNTLRTAYENLRTSYDDLRTKLQNTTLVA